MDVTEKVLAESSGSISLDAATVLSRHIVVDMAVFDDHETVVNDSSAVFGFVSVKLAVFDDAVHGIGHGMLGDASSVTVGVVVTNDAVFDVGVVSE